MSSSDKQKIVAIMKANSRHAYIATCDGDQPRVRPVALRLGGRGNPGAHPWRVEL